MTCWFHNSELHNPFLCNCFYHGWVIHGDPYAVGWLFWRKKHAKQPLRVSTHLLWCFFLRCSNYLHPNLLSCVATFPPKKNFHIISPTYQFIRAQKKPGQQKHTIFRCITVYVVCHNVIQKFWPNGKIFHQPIDFPEIAGGISLTIHHHLGANRSWLVIGFKLWPSHHLHPWLGR